MNKPDRLLSDDEMIDATPYLTTNDVADGCHICSRRIAKAQDLKTAAAVNAEWVSIINSILINSPTPYALKGSLLNLLAKRMKEIGL